MKKIIFLILLMLLLAGMTTAANNSIRQNIRALEPAKTATPPVLDGSLDDPVWKSAALVDDVWVTYNPVNGNEMPQRTRAYMAYDDENIYIAFHCFDNQPDKIKTSLTKRDGMFGDDWVGLSLDTVGGKKYGYELFVRALVQYDSFYNKVLGDFLASFTYIPDTVIYLGYGTLNESQAWVNGRWQRDVTGERYYQTRQSLFFKVSYRYQF